jgi:hypothetical protein
MIPLIANPWRRTCFSGRAEIQRDVLAGNNWSNFGARDNALYR